MSEKKTEIGKLKDALSALVNGTAKFSNPPKATDADQLLQSAIVELDALRSHIPEEIKPLKLMFIDPQRISSVIYVMDMAGGKVVESRRVAGNALASTRIIADMIKRHNVAKVIIDHQGIGTGYADTLRERISTILSMI